MGPNWRMWLKSWWVWLKSPLVWVATVCLVYMELYKYAPRIEALWPWAWPWSGFIAAVSLLLALLILAYIGVYYVVHHMARPALTSFVDKELHRRTAKAKEKYADGLMSCSTALCSATFIALLLFPLTAFIQVITSETTPVMPWMLQYVVHAPGWEVMLYVFVLYALLGLPLALATWFRRRALALYDELATLAPAVAPTAQGTTKQSTIPDPGPPAYVRANGDSRRRRHRRGR